MNSKIARLAAAVMAVGLFTGSAMAGYPPSIAGTWDAQDNRSMVTIIINQPTSGGPTCDGISGTIGPDNLAGFYCPTTGRFNFIRTNSTTGVTFQEYSGNVSAIGTSGTPNFMSGIFGSLTGSYGEYSFCAYPPSQLHDKPDTQPAAARGWLGCMLYQEADSGPFVGVYFRADVKNDPAAFARINGLN